MRRNNCLRKNTDKNDRKRLICRRIPETDSFLAFIKDFGYTNGCAAALRRSNHTMNIREVYHGFITRVAENRL